MGQRPTWQCSSSGSRSSDILSKRDGFSTGSEASGVCQKRPARIDAQAIMLKSWILGPRSHCLANRQPFIGIERTIARAGAVRLEPFGLQRGVRDAELIRQQVARLFQ